MVLRHVSILKDHPQGVCLYLAKVTELFKHVGVPLNIFMYFNEIDTLD